MINGRRPGIVLVIACTLAAVTSTSWAGPGVGKEFPSFDAKDALTGKRFSLTDLRGRVVLVDFWATWCRPCIAEVPNVRRVHRKYKDAGFDVVSISLDKNRSRFKSYAKKNGMKWYHVMEGGGWGTRLAKKYGVRSIPAMYLLDHEGKVISTKARGQELERLVAKAVGKLPDRPAGRVAEKPSSSKKRRGSGDRAESLRSDISEARTRLGTVAEPLDELDASLGDARKEIRALETRLTDARAGDSAQRRYTRLREDLARIRCHLFACGAPGQSVRLPEEVFRKGQKPKRTDFLRAASQLPVAADAVIALDRQLARVRRDVTAMDGELADLQQSLRRGTSGSLTSRGAKVLKDTNALVAKCRTSWQRQIDTATKMVESLGASGKDEAALCDAIARQIEVCRRQLEDLAFGDVGPETVSDTLGAICGDLSALARQTDAGTAIRLPRNPMKGARASDLRARVQAAAELDVARKAVAQMRDLENSLAADSEAAEIRRELVALQAATRDARGDERLEALQRDFIRLAGRLLALNDRLGDSS